jgi:dihydropteroate synthase
MSDSSEIHLQEALGRELWLVMGILNVTPDSFHDGGRFADVETAYIHARVMAAEGAAIIDVGGESTRPGAASISLKEELDRVIPVVEAIVGEHGVPISVDTCKAEVARQALKAGAAMINDTTALRGDEDMAKVVAEFGCPVCLMHMQGTPRNMQADPRYTDVVGEIAEFFQERIEWAVSHGVERDNIILDPGIGFGKKLEHNLAIIKHLDRFLSLDQPLLIGASHKSFLGAIAGDPGTEDRLFGTIATTVLAYQKGARIFRVHDVAGNVQALKVAVAIEEA